LGEADFLVGADAHIRPPYQGLIANNKNATRLGGGFCNKYPIS